MAGCQAGGSESPGHWRKVLAEISPGSALAETFPSVSSPASDPNAEEGSTSAKWKGTDELVQRGPSKPHDGSKSQECSISLGYSVGNSFPDHHELPRHCFTSGALGRKGIRAPCEESSASTLLPSPTIIFM